MSFYGTLLRVEDAPDGNRGASDHPEQTYKRWRMVVKDEHGAEQSACTGRSDIIERAREMIGREVTILRGGKLGIVGGIRPGKDFPL